MSLNKLCLVLFGVTEEAGDLCPEVQRAEVESHVAVGRSVSLQKLWLLTYKMKKKSPVLQQVNFNFRHANGTVDAEKFSVNPALSVVFKSLGDLLSVSLSLIL
jgi:hypothetical protein